MKSISFLKSYGQRWRIFACASSVWALLWFGVGGCAGSAPSSGRESSPILPWGGGGTKIGYIRSDVIMQKLPEYRDAENTLQRENEGWLKEAENLESQIRIKESQLEELR
ncbi:MAG: OmpH family outer membrane protein, partial [bacterium]